MNGTLEPFIELGVGFNPELTGRENVFLNGALLGFSRRQMEAMYDEIVEFAELKRFMDQKLKNYSSGMQVRLAFSIAIRAESDILVLDEVLAVGDESFQQKCFSFFAELKRNKKTVILVTHSMDSVQQFCNKALLIDAGKVVEYGNPSQVAGRYTELNNQVRPDDNKDVIKDARDSNREISAEVQMSDDEENIHFDIEINSKAILEDSVITFVMNRDTGEKIFQWSTDELFGKSINIEKGSKVKASLTIANIFPDGKYDVQLAVKKSDRSKIHALFNRICVFDVVNKDPLKRNSNWKPKVKASVKL